MNDLLLKPIQIRHLTLRNRIAMPPMATGKAVDGMPDDALIAHYCARAKVHAIICFGIGLTLREGNREYFYDALDRYFPAAPGQQSLKQRYIKTFGYSYMVNSPNNYALMSHLSQLCKRNNIMLGTDSVFKWMEEFPEGDPAQPELF